MSKTTLPFAKPAIAFLVAAGLALSPLPAMAATLSANAEAALLSALDDEYHAEAFYEAVMDKFGPVRPFSNIANAERQHEAALIDRLKAYGIAVPANPYMSGDKKLEAVPTTIAEACAIGVGAEIANRDLYRKELLPAVTDYPDITAVFKALSAASEQKHLPAFQRCAN